MLVITGPSGNVGRELVNILAPRMPAKQWRVASRHPETLLRQVGTAAPPCAFDFSDRSTWEPALRGVRSLFLLFPLPSNHAARADVVPFVHAAAEAGCNHVVYVSVFGADKAPFIPHHKVEAALQDSGMTTTVLRCSFFMQNLHRAISTHGTDIVERGELFIPAGRGLTSFIDARDAAEVAALALTDSAPRDRVHHLTGPAAVSMEEVADALTEALGVPITYTRPGLARFAARLQRRGVRWDTVAFMSVVYTLTRLNFNQPITDDVARLLGRPPRTLRQFLAESAWRWHDRSWT